MTVKKQGALGKLFRSAAYRVAKGYLHSWGIGVLIMGIAFKSENLPGSDAMIALSMAVLGMLYFLSGLESLMKRKKY